MSLESFVHDLHFETDKARPPELEVDWEDAPLSYKLYRGLPVIPFSPEIPLSVETRDISGQPDFHEIGHFLWYVYGLTQICQSVLPLDARNESMNIFHSYRRFTPSGGALYPNEIYVYLKLEDLPFGVYHYDVAHHRLILLREGDFDLYLSRVLGNRCDVSACFGTVFVSTFFWKNFYKYYNFSYRLQGLDAGVVIGQLLEASKRFGFASRVYVQFLDRAINHLLGLSEQEESVYAIIPLSKKPVNIRRVYKKEEKEADVSATGLCRSLAAVRHNHYVRSRRVKEYPDLIRMNEASMLESTLSFKRIESKKCINYGLKVAFLPRVKKLGYDFAAVCRKRFSPEMDFVLGKVSNHELSALLQEAAASFLYQNDLDEIGGTDRLTGNRVELYVCLHGVEGIPDGAYRYDGTFHALWEIEPGNQRFLLQRAMTFGNVNLFQVPFCFHVIGDKDHLKTVLGYRGYRIQQMEAGMLVQRLLLAASALGMGGHPLLGFNVIMCDEIYRLTREEKTCLIQIPVGYYRQRPRLEGSIHS